MKTFFKLFITAIDFLFIVAIGLIIYYYFPEPKLPKGAVVDTLVVHKSAHKMMVYANGVLLKTYTVSFGDNPVGHKQFEGDERTPEGIYSINAKNPNSVCYKNLGTSYPNQNDREQAKQLGKPTGGDIKIHGLPNGQGYIGKFQRWSNWTNGCIAVTNNEMDELYDTVRLGAKIEILP